jgi:hypothetical protein
MKSGNGLLIQLDIARGAPPDDDFRLRESSFHLHAWGIDQETQLSHGPGRRLKPMELQI